MTQFVRTLCQPSAAQGLDQKLSVNEPPERDCYEKAASGDRIAETSSLTKNKALAEREETQDEKFELLSAYIDGEVSDKERQQVEQWLVSDARLQQQYKAQLKLSRAMKAWFLGG